jgi:hypothetical protein
MAIKILRRIFLHFSKKSVKIKVWLKRIYTKNCGTKKPSAKPAHIIARLKMGKEESAGYGKIKTGKFIRWFTENPAP